MIMQNHYDNCPTCNTYTVLATPNAGKAIITDIEIQATDPEPQCLNCIETQ